jgi:hypothetical protein
VLYYIESFYNRRRRYSVSNYLGSEAYEQLFCQQGLIFA